MPIESLEIELVMNLNRIYKKYKFIHLWRLLFNLHSLVFYLVYYENGQILDIRYQINYV